MRTLLLLLIASGCRLTVIDTQPDTDPDTDVDTDVDTDDTDVDRPVDVDDDGYGASVDCDDDDPDVFPGAPERCDGVDEDCDERVDDDPVDGSTWYLDDDGDGFGDPHRPVRACTRPSESATQAGDCDDGTASRNPDADEMCNGVDDDCDTRVDLADGDLEDAAFFYPDLDEDGFGDPSDPTRACGAPTGHVGNNLDCDDSTALSNPARTEVCDGFDNDCTDGADVGAIDGHRYYVDSDRDGHGATGSILSCELLPPTGFARENDDCNDGNSGVNPLASEVCDVLDNDCDTLIDAADPELVGGAVLYVDVDRDGHGDPMLATRSCTLSPPVGFSASGDDCDDDAVLVNPRAIERCNGYDDDCDGRSDTDDTAVTGTVRFWLDLDGDGRGREGSDLLRCTSPGADWVALAGDCDDADETVHQGHAQACDDVDHDCDGRVDFDADDDGYSATSCGGADCDDANEFVVPDATRTCVHGIDCRDVKNTGAGSADGIYTIDPDGLDLGQAAFRAVCLQSFAGGGWTLLGIEGAFWDSVSVRDNSTWGALTDTGNMKTEAWNRLLFRDVLFRDTAGMWARYDNVGDASESWQLFQHDIPERNCAITQPQYSWVMGGGTLAGANLCSTRLYLHPADHDGGNCKPTSDEAGVGPTWSVSRNDGCPLDDPNQSGFVNSATAPWGNGLRMYVR